ncbi:hypothetical protein BV22DRAFT_1057873 [Leucogyrophana mollusca]|uniref:Uncharacterized protein n=1 Tax=Leucogyrophana mollusca TaxID=85980 RepID=A0ACB8BUQ6_9AGAM|nr:hypothetical protein BV22DRAFT_1057873 [Leucogyrophana mollusca]
MFSPPSEAPPRRPIPRDTVGAPLLSSSACHVDLDYFDPQGVGELRHTISRLSSQSVQPESQETTSSETIGGHSYDFEKVLRDVIKKRDEADVKSRELGVVFDQLRVVGMGASASFQPTLGSILNPRSVVESINGIRHPSLRNILKGFQGVVRPGEMLLVLGRPGSGCSTFLKVLANQRQEFYAVEGDIHYNSFSPQDISKHHRGDVQYCPEDDIHFPTLTVEQTIDFAAKTRAPQARANNQTRVSYWKSMTEILTTVFGLRHVKKSPIGDAAIRGISGGEKKRVSISEALATRSLVTSWDNSTRGLDASTAVEFVRALRIATDIARLSTIVSIYQAGESLYEMFDKVCVIYDGRMIYFGPANQARQYFVAMGYSPANRQTTADFLVAVTDPLGRNVRPNVTPPPATASEFEDYYKKSAEMKVNREDIETFRGEFVGKDHLVSAFQESTRAERARHTRDNSPYTISIPMQIRAVMTRRVQIMRGSIAAQLINTVAFVLQAIILGTTFLTLSPATDGYYSRGGILFFSIFLPALFAMSEIPSLFAQRPIVQRHQKAAMYHPFIEGLALTLVDIPVTLFTIVIYTIVLYFLVGLQRTAGQFFIFFLFVFTTAVIMKALFRSLAAAFKGEAPAQSIAGIIVLALALYTGYLIPKPAMIGALKWISYINPIRYSFEALLTNEFHTINGACEMVVPSGAGYTTFPQNNKACTTVGSIAGDLLVSGDRFVALSFGFSYSHLWRNFGIIIAFGVFFTTALLVFTEYNTGVSGQSVVTLFKRGSKASAVQDAVSATSSIDVEKNRTSPPGAIVNSDSGIKPQQDAQKALAEQPKMTDIFTWQHMQYDISARRLLDDVTGYVAPGKLTALMGESGAGKTTLLNVLAERVGSGVISGDRFVNGHPLPSDFQGQTGYCQQTDTHLPTMTVREALLFSAKMRQPFSIPMAEKEAYVDKCLAMCGLEAFRDAVVGSLGVEHKKRTTIGVELAAKPKLLLFLDEPTSGLDSQSAWAIVSFLRDLADSGQAILCTIHQPSAELFQVFDRLLLLRKGGQTVYFGDLGPNASTVIRYFENQGSRLCNPNENPAEFMLDVIGAGATATTTSDWHDIWSSSHECAAIQEEIDAIHRNGRATPPITTTLHSTFATPWIFQTWALYERDMMDHWRDPTYLMAKIMLNIVGGLFIGFTFFKRNDTLRGTQDKLFAVYMATILSVPLVNQLQVIFLRTRSIYEVRERQSRMYGWTALVTSQILVEIPWNILGSTLFFICWYWTVGFSSSRGGYAYLLLGVLFPAYYTTIGQAVSAMSPTAEIAGILFSFLFSFVLTFNGVLQPYAKLGFWQWTYRISPYTYLIEGLVAQVVGGGQLITCSSEELSIVEPPSGYTCGSYLGPYILSQGGYVVDPDASSGCEYCSERTADAWLYRMFNIQYSHRWRDLGFFCAFIVFNTAMVYIFTYLFRIRSYAFIETYIARCRGWFASRWSKSSSPQDDL